jgi:hypothetical protein
MIRFLYNAHWKKKINSLTNFIASSSTKVFFITHEILEKTLGKTIVYKDIMWNCLFYVAQLI